MAVSLCWLKAFNLAARPIRVKVEIARERIWLLVWRQGEKVVYRRSEPTEFRVLRTLDQSVRFAPLCDRVAKGIGAKTATTRVAAWLQQWLHDQVLTRPFATPR